MSVKAKAMTFEATSCCASPSPSARSQAPSPQLYPEALANRPGPQEPGQKGNCGDQRVPLLPGFKADVRAGVAIDLPRNVVGTAAEGQARLGQAGDGIELPVT